MAIDIISTEHRRDSSLQQTINLFTFVKLRFKRIEKGIIFQDFIFLGEAQ